MVEKPEAWRWSTAGAHAKGKVDIFVRTEPLPAMIKSPLGKLLSGGAQVSEMALFRKQARTG